MNICILFHRTGQAGLVGWCIQMERITCQLDSEECLLPNQDALWLEQNHLDRFQDHNANYFMTRTMSCFNTYFWVDIAD